MIGETRQTVAAPEPSFDQPWAARGILNTPPPEPFFRVERHRPSAQLSDFIENYWSVRWDLREGQIHVQETLPHPNVHVVFEASGGNAFGVVSGKFARRLEGTSRVFGVRFAPGMFRGFLGKPVASLTDKSIPAKQVFGDEVCGFETALECATVDGERVALADRFFASRLPSTDARATLAHALVRHAREVREVLRVEQLAEAFELGSRTMQRLFAEYVGISPKWVIRRYRLQEAVTRLRSDPEPDFVNLALALGYYDQAHLINDFKSILGYTPVDFHRHR